MNGNANKEFRLLSVDAWADGDGGWSWNQWFDRGTVPAEWVDLKPRELLHKLREHGGVYPPPGQCAVEDDGHNIVVMMRGTREPIAAIEYGGAA